MSSRRRHPEDFSHSITDLMTSIAVIFVLLFLFFAQQQHEETEAKVNKTENLVSNLLDELKREFGPLKIKVAPREGDPLTIEVTLPERYRGSLTFRQNERTLLPEGKRLVTDIIPRLVRIVCRDAFQEHVDSIVVEGHASSEGSLSWNVDLSADRAAEVLLFGLGQLPPGQGRECFEGLAAASGRGAWHLRTYEDGSENPELSRRVVFRVRVKSMEQRSEDATLAGDNPALAGAESS